MLSSLFIEKPHLWQWVAKLAASYNWPAAVSSQDSCSLAWIILLRPAVTQSAPAIDFISYFHESFMKTKHM